MSEEQKMSKLDEEVEAHKHRVAQNDEPAEEGDEVEAHSRLDGRVDGRTDGRSDARSD